MDDLDVAPVKSDGDTGKIHTTIGLYRNGEYVVNGVKDDHLEDHVKYNIACRGGRALFVDGKCVHTGYMSREECDEFIISTAGKIVATKCTAPYV
ncbi:MAG: hypothetical protein ACRCUK_10690 [Plesiomonas shigelloides]